MMVRKCPQKGSCSKSLEQVEFGRNHWKKVRMCQWCSTAGTECCILILFFQTRQLIKILNSGFEFISHWYNLPDFEVTFSFRKKLEKKN